VGRGQAARKTGAVTTTFVALLRGVNVGGANRVTTAALQAAFADAGGDAVETLPHSGNVVFDASANAGEAIAARAHKLLARGPDFDAPIALRDGDDWLRLVAGNPFLAAGADSDILHAACLSAAPSAARIARLEPDRSPADAFVVVGADVYLSLPNGVARSKLSNAWLEARLGIVSTMRNWRIVTKLAAMVEARRR
jgi:uncharacterized protein (DUF1697 family)